MHIQIHTEIHTHTYTQTFTPRYLHTKSHTHTEGETRWLLVASTQAVPAVPTPDSRSDAALGAHSQQGQCLAPKSALQRSNPFASTEWPSGAHLRAWACGAQMLGPFLVTEAALGEASSPLTETAVSAALPQAGAPVAPGLAEPRAKPLLSLLTIPE